MGLFQKNAASKLFSSSFAIDSDKTIVDVVEKDVMPDKTVEDILVDEVLNKEIEEASFEPIEPEEYDSEHQSLSIAQIIQLVRSLPQQGTDVELHAVLRTLELFNIDIRNVLEDSYRKESVTAQRIDTLLSEISTLDDEIDKRAKEIKMLEVGITEMARVNECLELMLKLDDELLEAEQEPPVVEGSTTSSIEDAEEDQADDEQNSSYQEPESEATILSSKSAAEKLDEYVKEGKTQTLDGIVIDLDGPPKKQKLKLSKKSKAAKAIKRKSKRLAEQEA